MPVNTAATSWERSAPLQRRRVSPLRWAVITAWISSSGRTTRAVRLRMNSTPARNTTSAMNTTPPGAGAAQLLGLAVGPDHGLAVDLVELSGVVDHAAAHHRIAAKQRRLEPGHAVQDLRFLRFGDVVPGPGEGRPERLGLRVREGGAAAGGRHDGKHVHAGVDRPFVALDDHRDGRGHAVENADGAHRHEQVETHQDPGPDPDRLCQSHLRALR